MSSYGHKHHQINKITATANGDTLERGESWRAIAKSTEQPTAAQHAPITHDIIYIGKNLQGGNFSGENLENANFSGSNLQEINLCNANLQNVDFTGADLSGADLSGANMDGAIFTGAKLIGVNFTGAHMHGVKLINADLQDAILTDADLDNLTIEELQELVEYLALYYPQKLNLSRLNLTLLDLRRIDLRRVNLRGVDFTGCNFFGVNIYELDLSECVISPAQIEQAIGHQPTPDELQKILAPKKRDKKKQKAKGIDFTDFFDSRGGFDWDTTKGGSSFDKLIKSGQEFFGHKKKQTEKEGNEPQTANSKPEKAQNNNSDDLRKSIEQHKRDVLEQRREQLASAEYAAAKSRENRAPIINSHSSNER